MSEAGTPRRFTPEDMRVRLETVRRDISLPGDALVMRGGTLQKSDLQRSLIKARIKLKRPGLSVYAADVPTDRDLFNLHPLPQGHIAFTTVERIRAEGFELEQTFDWPHHTAWLPEDDADDDGYWIQMFCRAFDDPVPRSTVVS